MERDPLDIGALNSTEENQAWLPNIKSEQLYYDEFTYVDDFKSKEFVAESTTFARTSSELCNSIVNHQEEIQWQLLSPPVAWMSENAEEIEGPSQIHSLIDVKEEQLEGETPTSGFQCSLFDDPAVSNQNFQSQNIGGIPRVTIQENFSIIPNKCQTEALHCKYCNLQFPTMSALISHKKLLHTQTFVCKNCKKIFLTCNDLVNHLQCDHKQWKLLHCNDCVKKFKYHNSEEFEIHIIKHNNFSPFPCKQENCYQRFSTISYLQNHVASYHIPLTCKTCGNKFITVPKEKKLEMPLECVACVKAKQNISLQKCNIKATLLCDYCKNTFQSKSLLNKHVTLVHKQFDCNKTLKTHKLLNTHLDNHNNDFSNEEKNAQYVKIDLTIDNVPEICTATNTNSDQNSKVKECNYCNSKFTRSVDLIEHLKSEHIICGFCDKRFKTKTSLSSHMLNHNYPKIKKNKRNKTGSQNIDTNKSDHKKTGIVADNSNENLNSNTSKCLNVGNLPGAELPILNSNASTNSDQNSKLYKCNYCNKVYTFWLNYYTHVKTKHELVCKTCGKGFMKKNALSLHMSNHIQVRAKNCVVNKNESEKVLIKSGDNNLRQQKKRKAKNIDLLCAECGKMYQNKTMFDLHILSHMQVNEHPVLHYCKICNKSFISSIYLRNHTRRVHGKIKLQLALSCDLCGKILTSKYCLTLHMKRHLCIKKHKCMICEKSFVKRCDLNRHLESHVNIRKYPCKKCKMDFESRDELQLHYKNHTDLRLFTCQICSAVFLYKHVLTDHFQNIHSKLRPYNCNYCVKIFKTKEAIRRHIYTHKDYHPFQCNLCDKQFIAEHCLSAHVQRVHQKND